MKSVIFKSLADLLVSANKAGGGIDGKNPTSRATLKDIKYSARAKQLRYTYSFTPQNDNKPAKIYARVFGKNYRTVLLFGKTAAHDTITKGVIPKKIDGVYVQRPSMNTTPVKVSCTCARFEKMYSFQNQKKKALPPEFTLIPYANYQAKMNPKNLAGVCKHIIKAIKSSRRRRII